MPVDESEWDEWLGFLEVDSDGNWSLRTGVPERAVRALAFSSDPRHREAVARQQGLTVELAAELVMDEEENVVEALAENESAPPRALEELVDHPSAWVREQLAWNPSLPLIALQRLAHDPDLDIAVVAEEALNRREEAAAARGESLYLDKEVERNVRLGNLEGAESLVEDAWLFAQFHESLEHVGLAFAATGQYDKANEVVGRIIGHRGFSEGHQNRLLSLIAQGWARQQEWARIPEALDDVYGAEERAQLLAQVASIALELGAIPEAAKFTFDALEEQHHHRERRLKDWVDSQHSPINVEFATKTMQEMIASLLPDGRGDKGSASPVSFPPPSAVNEDPPDLSRVIAASVVERESLLLSIGRAGEAQLLREVAERLRNDILSVDSALAEYDLWGAQKPMQHIYQTVRSEPTLDSTCITDWLDPIVERMPPLQWLSIVMSGHVGHPERPDAEAGNVEFLVVRIPPGEAGASYYGLGPPTRHASGVSVHSSEGHVQLVRGRLADLGSSLSPLDGETEENADGFDFRLLGSPTLHPMWPRVWIHPSTWAVRSGSRFPSGPRCGHRAVRSERSDQ